MKNSVVRLKPGKEVPLLRKHPWIFSGAIDSLPEFIDGAILPIADAQGNILAWGYFNRKTNIIGRILSFSPESNPSTVIGELIGKAMDLRKQWISEDTNAYRVVNAEGDSLPGLVVDKYADYLVVQIHTLGMDHQRETIIESLVKAFNPKGIYEKSSGTSRRYEGLKDKSGCLYGKVPAQVEIKENGHTFFVDIIEGQKTGFFLDQRPMRQRIGELSKGHKILNCFCYTGGFSVYALAGGCLKVDSVDVSEKAIQQTEVNLKANKTDALWNNHAVDVFTFLKDDSLDYDLIILDPPAFAKKQIDIKNASKGYRDLNKMAMCKAKPGTLLLTCSCSQPISDEAFLKILFDAALESGRIVQVLEKQRHGLDHPVSIFHPEGTYLKGYLLRIL
ncbi:MAG: class I SAM-dependent rRNA methyltransferase [Parachlamydiales bacterium]